MNRTPLILFFCGIVSSNLGAQTVTGTINDDGFIVVSGDSVELFGVDLISEGGFLVPIEGNDASPFGFLLQNSAKQITYATLGEPLKLNGDLVLSAGYKNGPGFDGDLTGEWGGPVLDGVVSFVAPASETLVPVPDVPEPNSGLLALLGVGALLGVRRRRISRR